MSIDLELMQYVDDLHSSTDECERPKDGEKCVQCRERERVIDKLERILKMIGVQRDPKGNWHKC